MNWRHTERSFNDFERAPAAVRRAFEKQIELLSQDLRHPSVRAKRFSGTLDLWQGRINRDWRFYFRICGNEIVVARLIPHPK
jgi:hypothetical protein